ncbi:MAG: carboxylating nicotinate-nucleotide diphosphorylase [Gemmatimonadota bacterium]|jgi:nicotinate-nucleotide pyrophosphorylase (carboxylating)
MTVSDSSALARARSALIQLALEEDVGEGDWTTLWTVDAELTAEAAVIAKVPLVVSGTECVVETFRSLDPRLAVDVAVDDGTPVEAGRVLVRLRGPAHALLVGERTALNFLGRLSGIASMTRRFVDRVAGTGARIMDTRKTTPGWRLLEKAAVRDGGGSNHRVGLFDMVLVKDSHIDAAGGIDAAVRSALARNDRRLPVEVEVRTFEELEDLLAFEVDRILLDNMPPEALRRAVARVRELGAGRPELEASGNVTLENVRSVAETGVDFVSIGALTHSAPSADVSLRVAS